MAKRSALIDLCTIPGASHTCGQMGSSRPKICPGGGGEPEEVEGEKDARMKRKTEKRKKKKKE